jgi:hypothetical protein
MVCTYLVILGGDYITYLLLVKGKQVTKFKLNGSHGKCTIAYCHKVKAWREDTSNSICHWYLGRKAGAVGFSKAK